MQQSIEGISVSKNDGEHSPLGLSGYARNKCLQVLAGELFWPSRATDFWKDAFTSSYAFAIHSSRFTSDVPFPNNLGSWLSPSVSESIHCQWIYILWIQTESTCHMYALTYSEERPDKRPRNELQVLLVVREDLFYRLIPDVPQAPLVPEQEHSHFISKSFFHEKLSVGKCIIRANLLSAKTW